MPTPTHAIRLRADDIQRRLTTRRLARSLHLFDEVASTNDMAFTFASSGAVDGTAVLAEHQTAGKGRLGRQWVSPPHLNIYASVILTTLRFSQSLSWMPLVTGLALAEAIHKSCGVMIALKWPNDLLCSDKKLGGVLCESSSQNQPGLTCVMGFGINVNGGDKDLPEELRSTAASLHQETQAFFDRNVLVADMFNRLESWYAAVDSGQFEHIRKSYIEACATLGRDVQVSYMDGTAVQGIADTIGQDGALRVSTVRRGRPHTVDIRAADVQHLR